MHVSEGTAVTLLCRVRVRSRDTHLHIQEKEDPMFRGHRSLRCDRVVSLRACAAAAVAPVSRPALLEVLEARQLMSAAPAAVAVNPGSAPNGPYGLVASPAGQTSVNLSFRENSNNESGFIV